MKSGPSRDGENEDAEREGSVDDGGEDEGLFCLEKKATSAGFFLEITKAARVVKWSSHLNGRAGSAKRKCFRSMTPWRLMIGLGLGGIAIASLGSTIQQALVTVDDHERDQLYELSKGLGMDELKNAGFWASSKSESESYLPCVWGGISCGHTTKGVQVTKRVKFLNLGRAAASQQAFWSLPEDFFVKGWSGLRYLDLSNYILILRWCLWGSHGASALGSVEYLLSGSLPSETSLAELVYLDTTSTYLEGELRRASVTRRARYIYWLLRKPSITRRMRRDYMCFRKY